VIAVFLISELVLRRELNGVLSGAGWTVRPARDPDEALALCRQLEADVLLIDEDVPGGTIAFLDRMNANAQRMQTGVVVVGDNLDVDSVVSAMKRGAADVLRTPVDPGDTVARAASAARTKALVKQLTEHNSHIEGLVIFDELTGLRNRRAIMLELETMVATARRHKRPFAALMVDVDHFKAINDTLGHRAGDEVLREIGRRLCERLRGADVAGRFGGDEVLVLLPETDAGGAAVLAASIRDAVGASPVPTGAGPIVVTLSIGAAEWTGETAELLLDRADQALYAAKAGGRDQSVAAS
jgi:two-component system cell cycle response regulator